MFSPNYISEINATDYDAVIFVGGSGSNIYFNDKAAHKIIKDTVSAGKVLGAICIAPSILANAGVLQNKNVTSFPSQKDFLIKKGADYTGDKVTVDEKIITANGPNAAKEFGEKIVKTLEQ